ncbi:hypothetical protein BJ170DRAFT_481936 [Xylariales sp. AK1849]|nr:hypothetical protein BJ170DRAFT_481936 [Xylariales sp. AK1849]
MALAAQPAAQLEVFSDASFTSVTSDNSSIDLGNNRVAPLGSLSVSHSQNRQSKSGSMVDSLTTELKKLHIREPYEISNRSKRQPICDVRNKARSGIGLTRPPLTANTFEVLETVPEDEIQNPFRSAAVSVSDDTQNYIELPADQYTEHPLAVAARNLPSIEEQFAKHRAGDFDWVLTIKAPNRLPKDRPASNPIEQRYREVDKVFFGCNLLPTKAQARDGQRSKNTSSGTYTLLVTPLEGTEELKAATESPVNEKSMALAEVTSEYSTPLKALDSQLKVRVEEVTPASTESTHDGDSFVHAVTSRSSAKPAARIEDSIEALDEHEEQLEAFDVASQMRRLVSPDIDKLVAKSPRQEVTAKSQGSSRSTPQPKRTSPRTNCSTFRVKSTERRRSPSNRKPASKIFLDSPKLKGEDKALVQAPPKKPVSRGLASLLPPKQPVKSTKPPTVPTFELPGEAVARRLKEKREARLSLAATADPAPGPAASNLRRTKSAKPPTRPSFELPGEAISRRKRDEREAKLRAQEEEERKRREFKAKPIRSGTIPRSVPRETVASRARLNKGPQNSENLTHQTSPSPNKGALMHMSREPLATANNHSQPRGRHLTTGSSTASQLSRATSSSTGSVSGKRSSVSLEEAQQQRLRGKEILHRDSMFVQDREREKRERETLARLAREQAAERSRLQSREWAEKQKRKRVTVGSLRDVMASS